MLDESTAAVAEAPPKPERRGLQPLRARSREQPASPTSEPAVEALAAAQANVAAAAIPLVDRRQGDRRAMDALRAEALKAVMSRVEDRNFNGLRNQVDWQRKFKPSRIALVAVALIAGGIAAYLALQSEPGIVAAPAVEQPAPEVVREARVRVLAAKSTIGIGQKLSPSLLEWVDWPEGAVRDEYITVADTPDAIDSMGNIVARFEFFPGEPIRQQKLADPGQGYLSAVLDSGKRGVSVTVAAEAASGGFIVPNDHVDVVLTRMFDVSQISETILHNVRVLAINSRLGEVGTTGGQGDEAEEQQEKVFANAIATLELDPRQAEVIINGANIGTLSLVLRSMTDFAETEVTDQRPTNQAIRISSPFWAKN